MAADGRKFSRFTFKLKPDNAINRSSLLLNVITITYLFHMQMQNGAKKYG